LWQTFGILPQKKKKKSVKKIGKKHVVFSFQYQFFFQQEYTTFAKHIKGK
jgi:hypothetical protein